MGGILNVIHSTVPYIYMIKKLVIIFICVIDMSCRSRLAVLNEKLTTLERRIDYLEARVGKLALYCHSNQYKYIIIYSYFRS
jgi:hypothetical protein